MFIAIFCNVDIPLSTINIFCTLKNVNAFNKTLILLSSKWCIVICFVVISSQQFPRVLAVAAGWRNHSKTDFSKRNLSSCLQLLILVIDYKYWGLSFTLNGSQFDTTKYSFLTYYFSINTQYQWLINETPGRYVTYVSLNIMRCQLLYSQSSKLRVISIFLFILQYIDYYTCQ